MSGDILTDLRAAIAKVKENPPYSVCWPHVVHPKYTAWKVVLDEPVDWDRDVYVPCAMLCGSGVVLRRPVA